MQGERLVLEYGIAIFQYECQGLALGQILLMRNVWIIFVHEAMNKLNPLIVVLKFS
jgi:hypothetical protein